MLILTRTQIAELILAEIPGVNLPGMWRAAQYACPKLSWLRGKFAAQWQAERNARGLTRTAVAGRPVCDIFSSGMNYLLGVDLLVTGAAWQSGVDTSAAFFELRALLEAGVDYLGITSPTGGGHSTGLMIVENDLVPKTKPTDEHHPALVIHKEPQTGFDCPLAESLARGLWAVDLHD